MIYDELAAIRVWPSPFLPPIWPDPPELGPWVSSGRVSLAPELSRADWTTWHAATYVVLNPGRPLYALHTAGRLFGYLVEQQRDFWSLPDDPFAAAVAPWRDL